MKNGNRQRAVLLSLGAAFLALTLLFLLNLWGHPPDLYTIALVDTNFVAPTTIRTSIASRLRAGADPSDYDCYICHERDKPPPLRFDTNHNLIIPEEHSDILMAHGRHDRNNNCFNCHNENNLELLQTRDGHELKLAESAALCGSCHGPTYRDWEAGVHGRTGGFWNTSVGERHRQICVDCHDPHHPKIPSRTPAPGPHPLHAQSQSTHP